MVYYISTTGNDTTGTGTQASPWKTLFKATSTVKTAGDIIHIIAGTYTETQNSNLAVGVSIEGDNKDTTIVKSNLTGDWSCLLTLQSNEGVNGNQYVSGVTFDGQYVSESSFKTWWGIEVRGRSNVIINDCKIINFYDRGVVFDGNNVTDPTNWPTAYATGNKFYNNLLSNTARNSPNYIAGQFNFGGQSGMDIYNNTMTQTQRPLGKNGELIKMWDNGFNVGCRIHHNTLTRNSLSAANGEGQGDWSFAIELFNSAGLEVDNNTIIGGSIDINYNYKRTYAYSVWIHNNTIKHASLPNKKMDCGFILEFGTQDAIIENNIITSVACGFLFNVRTPSNSGGYSYPAPTGGYSAVTNVIIRNNLFTDLFTSYAYGFCCGGVGVRFYPEFESNDPYVRNLSITNNTFVCRSGAASDNGIDLSYFTAPAANADGVNISNNIFVGFKQAYVTGSLTKIKNLVLSKNDAWQCGNNNLPGFTGTYTNTGNLAVDPKFVSATDFNLQPSSPLFGLGIGWSGTNTPPPNQGPIVNAGADQTITLPTSTVSLAGSASDPDGTIVSYLWTKVSGSTSGTITNPTSANTTVTGLAQGSYTFKLTATDNVGATASDNVVVLVNPAPVNQTPTANAGPDQTITLPINSVTLNGNGVDPDGTIVSYLWTKVSGPATGTITNPNVGVTTVTNLSQGLYTYRLTVTDNNGATATDSIDITVNPVPVGNVPPVVSAGQNQTIGVSLTINLSGTASDPDGTIVSYLWTKVSGPSGSIIVTPNAISTSVYGVIVGTHIFKLTVTDNNGATASSDVTITIA